MPLQKFIQDHQYFPSGSRIWIYQSNRILTDEEVEITQIELTKFINTWAAHGAKVKGSFAILHNAFIILIADETDVKASGCSIDSSVAIIRKLATTLQVDFFDRFSVAYIEDNQLNIADKSKFGELANKENLIVFNNAVSTFSAIQNKWKIPYKGSWQENFFAEKTNFGLSL